MLTVDKTQFLDEQKYFEADQFSTCDTPGGGGLPYESDGDARRLA